MMADNDISQPLKHTLLHILALTKCNHYPNPGMTSFDHKDLAVMTIASKVNVFIASLNHSMETKVEVNFP